MKKLALNYKMVGKCAKYVLKLFMTIAVIVITIWAGTFVWSLGESIYDEHIKETICCDPDCYHSQYISQHVYYHSLEDGKSYVFNALTGKKTIKHIHWIVEPSGEDSLVCYSDGKKRGYFDKNNGKVVIEPKYDHAWIFSEGIASVDENGSIKFIDGTGKVIIDKNMTYSSDMDGYVFHGGYCVIGTEMGQYGLMDKSGVFVLPQEYDMIYLEEDYDLWVVQKGEEMAVFGKDMNPVVPFMECHIIISEGTIDATMPDHTMRKYDLTGKLINDFYISSVRLLEYEKDEILYRGSVSEEYDGDDEVKHIEMKPYHPKATARLRAYVTDWHHGLMTADGHIVTMPLYNDIDALGYDLYLCTSTNGDNVIVNGKGEIVK